jgi:Lanthionine-containing peptide SapB precursor RamS
MFDDLSVAEIDSQHVELLPARTTMALLDLQGLKPNGAYHHQAEGMESHLCLSDISLVLCQNI